LLQDSNVLPVDVLRKAKRPFGPSANPASATKNKIPDRQGLAP